MRRLHGIGFLLLTLTLASPIWSADIRSTPHNLTQKRADGSQPDEREICVFCHTPTISISGGQIPEQPPQWQSALPKDYSFTIYDDIGRLGLGKDSIGSQSIACMSCHDSNQALAVGKTSADHPFGVPYGGVFKQSPSSTRTTTSAKDGNSTAPTIKARTQVAYEDFRDVSKSTVEDRTVWWVSKDGVTTRRTRNDLPLYSRTEGDSGQQPTPHIECSSCHDPHTANATFLRINNTGSTLCLTCHNK